MQNKNKIIFLIGLILILVAACQNMNLGEQRFTGMDQAEVVDRLGEPDEIEELVKQTEYILGSIEGLWSEIEMGEKIVTWRYETWDGYKELYFLNDETTVAGESYWYKDSSKNPVY